jgi:predicted nucleotidyltransferase
MARGIALQYANAVKKDFLLRQMFLFGSTAAGTAEDDSDIDIAVIADDFTGDSIEDTFRLMKTRRKIDLRIEPHAFLPSEFHAGNPFAAEIMRTGIRIV